MVNDRGDEQVDPRSAGNDSSKDAGDTNSESGGRATSAGERVYRTLRDEIVFLDRAPGSALSEIEVAKHLKVGRAPVREALQRLSMNHLVDQLPGRGAFVSPITLSDMVKVSELRLQLEAFAATSAATRASTSERQALRKIRVTIDEFVGSSARSQLIRLDQDVHQAIYQATHNPYLAECLHRYLNLTLRAWVLVLDQIEGVPEMVDHHGPLLDAIIDGDSDRASTLAREHIEHFDQNIRIALSDPAMRLAMDRPRPLI